MPMWFIGFLVAAAFSVVAFLVMPKPKKQKPQAAADLENPTAEAGRVMPVLQGTAIMKAPNVLWYGDKDVNTREINA